MVEHWLFKGLQTPFRVLSRIYRLGGKSRVAAGHELPSGIRPGNFLKWICAEMQSGVFWDTILGTLWYFILFCSRDHVSLSYSVLRQRTLTSSALTSSRRDDFSDIVTVMMTILFGGSWPFWGRAVSFYPSNTLDRSPAFRVKHMQSNLALRTHG